MLTTMRRLPKLLAVTMHLSDVASKDASTLQPPNVSPKRASKRIVVKRNSFSGGSTTASTEDTTSVTGWSVEGSVASIVAKCKAGQQARRGRLGMAFDVGLGGPASPRWFRTKRKGGPREDMNV